MVDYILSEKSEVVDNYRLALIGNSWGGFLAAGEAAFEPPLSAAILIDGVWDPYAGFSTVLSPEPMAMHEAGNYTQFDKKVLRSASQRNSPPTPGLIMACGRSTLTCPLAFSTRASSIN